MCSGKMHRCATERVDMARLIVAPPFTEATNNVGLIFIIKPKTKVTVKKKNTIIVLHAS